MGRGQPAAERRRGGLAARPPCPASPCSPPPPPADGARRQLPDGWTELLPLLHRQPGDKTVTKHGWGAFHDIDLADHLGEHGVTQVVIAGVSTSAGVESTARQAYDRRLHVTLATDAMTDSDADAHAVERIFPRLGETDTAADVRRCSRHRLIAARGGYGQHPPRA